MTTDGSTEPPAVEKFIGDALVDEGVEAPKSCLGLEHEAWQPHLATEEDVEPSTKTRKRTEDAVAD